MKKILLFALIIVFQCSAYAFHNSTMLRIRDERGRAISVSVDGKRYNKISRSLTVGDLPAGRHSLKVYAYNSNGYGYRSGTLIYQGQIQTKAGRIYYCSIDKLNMDIEENCCIDDYGHWNNNDNWEDWDEEKQCWNNNRNWRNDDSYHKDGDYYNSWNNRDDNDNWQKRDEDYRGDNYNDQNWRSYSNVLSNGAYLQLIEQIRKASFESSKVSVANTGIRNNKITVKQLVGILNEFSFESTKLDFAKSSYRMVVDKRNYFLVNDVFTFQSSKDELNEFLGKQ